MRGSSPRMTTKWIKSTGIRCRARSSPLKLVRHHRPPHMFVDVAGERLGACGDCGIDERIAHAAEIDVEILRPRRPVRAEQSEKVQFVLNAAADRKAGLAMGERYVAGPSLRDALLDLPKG